MKKELRQRIFSNRHRLAYVLGLTRIKTGHVAFSNIMVAKKLFLFLSYSHTFRPLSQYIQLQFEDRRRPNALLCSSPACTRALRPVAPVDEQLNWQYDPVSRTNLPPQENSPISCLLHDLHCAFRTRRTRKVSTLGPAPTVTPSVEAHGSNDRLVPKAVHILNNTPPFSAYTHFRFFCSLPSCFSGPDLPPAAMPGRTT